jgi:AcrR family transcriptional regulator
MQAPLGIAVDPSVLDKLDLPGVIPARQERSRAMMLRLMERALLMLRDHSFAELSVADLCAIEGCTIGSFYARFQSKEAFLQAVQHAVVAEAAQWIEARLTPARFAEASLVEVLSRLVQGSVRWTRCHEGLIRASLRAAQDDARAWSPLRDLGRQQASRAMPILLAKLGRSARPVDADRVRFSFHVLFGTLNNMVLVNPGPFTIHDEATPRLLTETLARLISADA